jgi:hypothetical protein
MEQRVYIRKGFKSHIEKILCYPFKFKYLNQGFFYLTLKKHDFFLRNIEYIYERASNPTLKKHNFFSWEHGVYMRKGFKSHIEKILCYPFNLKYLNQKVFYPTLKKHDFFSWEHRVYILMGFKSHIEKT